MRTRTGTALVVGALALGCAGGLAFARASSVPAPVPGPTASGTTRGAAPHGVPQVPGDLRVATVEQRQDGVGPGGAPVVRWSVDWEMRWAPVPGAVSYAVRYASSEGVPAGSAADGATTGTSVRIAAAAGTSSPERQAVERDAGLLFTSSQLLVSISAVGADGVEGPPTGWVPVGDVPLDGEPVVTSLHAHLAAGTDEHRPGG